MTTRSLYRLYAKEVHGKEAIGFVSIENNWDAPPILTTLNRKGYIETCEIDYQQMIHFLARKMKDAKVKLN